MLWSACEFARRRVGDDEQGAVAIEKVAANITTEIAAVEPVAAREGLAPRLDVLAVDRIGLGPAVDVKAVGLSPAIGCGVRHGCPRPLAPR